MSHSKKWLVSAQDLEAMYIHYDGKECISLWCDGKQQQEQGAVGQKRKAKDGSHSSKRAEREEEVDNKNSKRSTRIAFLAHNCDSGPGW